jgi:hypothetical protein
LLYCTIFLPDLVGFNQRLLKGKTIGCGAKLSIALSLRET